MVPEIIQSLIVYNFWFFRVWIFLLNATNYEWKQLEVFDFFELHSVIRMDRFRPGVTQEAEAGG
jgi:hypothetical protein